MDLHERCSTSDEEDLACMSFLDLYAMLDSWIPGGAEQQLPLYIPQTRVTW